MALQGDINNIVYAATFHYLLEISYKSDDDFIYTWRTVEVYKNVHFGGEDYLYAYDVDKDDGIRLYRLDRLNGTQIFFIDFVPRWPIEINF